MNEKKVSSFRKFLSLGHHFKRSVAFSWKASPLFFLARIFIELLSVALPLVSLYFSRRAINILSLAGFSSQKTEFYQIILLIVCIQLFGTLMTRVNQYISGIHNDLVGNQIDLEIIDQINRLDISFFDNPVFYDQIQNSLRDSRSLQSLTWISLSFVRSVVQLVSNLVILISLRGYLPFLIALCCVPGILVDKFAAKRKYEWQLQRARNDRKLSYIKQILQSKGNAKDVRIFGVQDYFREKYVEMWRIWYDEKKKLDIQRMRLTFMASVLPVFATTFVLLIVGNGIFGGLLTLGDYTFYGGVSNQLLSSITTLTGVINQSYESEMRLSKYAEFLKLEPFVKNEGTKSIDNVEQIEFRNVSFTYPNTQRAVLQNVSFSLCKNQSVALVGLNGAGKSTIVKLLLRLYDPDSGEILVNGENIKSYDIHSYYRCVGTVFQDFSHYELQVREAVALTDITAIDDDARILKACKDADLDLRFIDPEKGLDTYLGKIFDPDGIELSGGNWQKFAIAQAYFRKASLMVFDEPNAALDPDAERRLFEKMLDLGRDKCVVYVTHRLSAATTADQIVVIKDGCCVEKGTHHELMESKGMYFELFSKQAQNYVQNA